MGLLDSIFSGQNDGAPAPQPAPSTGPLDPQYVDAIKKFEGYSPTPSWDYKQYSSGYGTKAASTDEKIDEPTAHARLTDALGTAAKAVDAINPNLPPGARAALISLTYNAGPGWTQSGLGDLVRAGDLQGAQARLLEYNKAGGQVNPGLVARRAQEASWFGQPQQSAQAPVAQQAAPAPQQPSLQPQASAPPQQQAAQPQASAPQQAAPSYWAQMPAEQFQAPPPIFYAPRKPIDLSGLQAALASGNRGLFFGKG